MARAIVVDHWPQHPSDAGTETLIVDSDILS